MKIKLNCRFLFLKLLTSQQLLALPLKGFNLNLNKLFFPGGIKQRRGKTNDTLMPNYSNKFE